MGTSRGKKPFSFLGIFMIIIVLAGLGMVYSGYVSIYRPAAGSGAGEAVTVTIPQGATTGEIADILYARGLIKNQVTFRLYVSYRGMGSRLKAGEYELNTGWAVPELLERLDSGDTTSYKFTIPEGFTVKQIADRLAERGIVDRAEFMDLAANGKFEYEFLRGLPQGPTRMEGYLFPDTYKIARHTAEKDIINMMLARFDQENRKLNLAAKAAVQGLTLHEAVTLASLVEREAQKDEERPKVAAVFINRLKKGWKLESCATIQYLLGQPKARLFERDLKIPSPYNTYLHTGLPPGPIASPGGPSLAAAVNPAPVNYMFFVVEEDGKHIFSRTLQEHNRNKAAYLRKLKESQ